MGTLGSSGDFASHPQIARRLRELIEKDRTYSRAARWGAIVELVTSGEMRGPSFEIAMRLLAAIELHTKFDINVIGLWQIALQREAARREAPQWVRIYSHLLDPDSSNLAKELYGHPQLFQRTLDRLTRSVMIGGEPANGVAFSGAELEVRAKRLFGSHLFWARFLRTQTSIGDHKADAIELCALANLPADAFAPDTDFDTENATLSTYLDELHAASTRLAGTRLVYFGSLTPAWTRIRSLITTTGGRVRVVDQAMHRNARSALDFMATELHKVDADIIVVAAHGFGSKQEFERGPTLAPADNQRVLLVLDGNPPPPNKLHGFSGTLQRQSSLDRLLLQLARYAPDTKREDDEQAPADTAAAPFPEAPATQFKPQLLPPQSTNALRFAANSDGALNLVTTIQPERFVRVRADLLRKANDLLGQIREGKPGFDLVAEMRPRIVTYANALQERDQDIWSLWSAGNSLRKALSRNIAISKLPEGWKEGFPPEFGEDLADLVETHNVAMAVHPDGVAFDAAKWSPGSTGAPSTTPAAQAVVEVLSLVPNIIEPRAARALSGVFGAARNAQGLDDATSRIEIAVGNDSFANALTALVEEGQRQTSALSLAERQVVAIEAQASALQEANELARAGMKPATWSSVAKSHLRNAIIGGSVAATATFIIAFAQPIIQAVQSIPNVGGAIVQAIQAMCRHFGI